MFIEHSQPPEHDTDRAPPPLHVPMPYDLLATIEVLKEREAELHAEKRMLVIDRDEWQAKASMLESEINTLKAERR
jgi:hypothetical protein